jgi:hypothetical protein
LERREAKRTKSRMTGMRGVRRCRDSRGTGIYRSKYRTIIKQ